MYATGVWSPHRAEDIRKTERMQRAATKMMANLYYEERLERIGLPNLEERRGRGDVIPVFQAIREIVRVDSEDVFIGDGG